MGEAISIALALIVVGLFLALAGAKTLRWRGEPRFSYETLALFLLAIVAVSLLLIVLLGDR